jgi:7-cyano-7-deazaguanine reductase
MTTLELKYLGKQGVPSDPPETFELDRVPNPVTSSYEYVARFTCPEVTSLCPATGQPDFAHVVIDYIPHKWLVESKSLKLFLTSFRNHGAFHEACSMLIARRLYDLLEPQWMRVSACWNARGGIPIDVFWQSGPPPSHVLVPPLDAPHYRARG